MYTLKILWYRHEHGKLVDQTTLFIPADTIRVHGETDEAKMHAWPEGSYQDYRWDIDGERKPGTLIWLDHDGKSMAYLATHAWLLGANGDTIERVTA